MSPHEGVHAMARGTACPWNMMVILIYAIGRTDWLGCLLAGRTRLDHRRVRVVCETSVVGWKSTVSSGSKCSGLRGHEISCRHNDCKYRQPPP